MKQIPDIIVPILQEHGVKESERKNPRQKEVTSFEQLPLALKADQVAAVLGISRAGAYNLMRSEGFPTLFIGKRMIVPKDKLIDWMDEHVGA